MFQKKMKPDQIDTVVGAGSRFQGDVLLMPLLLK